MKKRQFQLALAWERTSTFLKAHLWLMCLALVVIVWCFRLLSISYAGYPPVTTTNQTGSDQVAQQNILWYWQHGYHEGASTGDDNWFIKYPLYVIANSLPISPLKQQFVISLVLLIITAFLILYSLKGIIRLFTENVGQRRNALVGCSIFLAAVPLTAFFILTIPNSRNIELGMSCFLLLKLAGFLKFPPARPLHKNRNAYLLMVVAGCLLADDPLFVYELAAPFLLAVGIYYFAAKLSWRTATQLLGFALAALVLSRIIRQILQLVLPLKFIAHVSMIASYDGFLNNLRLLLVNGVKILGIDMWGRTPLAAGTLLTLSFMVIFGAALKGLVGRAVHDSPHVFKEILLIIGLTVIAIFLASTFFAERAVDRLSGRYIIMLLPLELIGLAFCLVRLRLARQQLFMAATLLIAFILVAGQSGRALAAHYHTQPEAEDYMIISQIESRGLHKGYAEYGRAVIESYLSAHKLFIGSVVCQKPVNTLTYFDTLSEKSVFTKSAQRSFYLFSPANSSDCTAPQLAAQFGSPSQIVRLSDGEYLAIYNYDIGTRINGL